MRISSHRQQDKLRSAPGHHRWWHTHTHIDTMAILMHSVAFPTWLADWLLAQCGRMQSSEYGLESLFKRGWSRIKLCTCNTSSFSAAVWTEQVPPWCGTVLWLFVVDTLSVAIVPSVWLHVKCTTSCQHCWMEMAINRLFFSQNYCRLQWDQRQLFSGMSAVLRYILKTGST